MIGVDEVFSTCGFEAVLVTWLVLCFSALHGHIDLRFCAHRDFSVFKCETRCVHLMEKELSGGDGVYVKVLNYKSSTAPSTICKRSVSSNALSLNN